MAKIAGYKGRVDISRDGGTTWLSLKGLTSATQSAEPETEDVTTFDDDGYTNEEPIPETVTYSLEGICIANDPGLEAMRFARVTKSPILFKYYFNKDDLTRYQTGSAWITSEEIPNEVDGKVKYTFELGAKGITQHVRGMGL